MGILNTNMAISKQRMVNRYGDRFAGKPPAARRAVENVVDARWFQRQVKS